ncbi:MAG: NADH-quinone oxidoreductase subunit A [Dehalococcoidia bacterium]|nr:NADH-quinone oxidoreductase subunit A [Dehalococcoidia bacterium]
MVESGKYWIIAAMGVAAVLVPLSLMIFSGMLQRIRIRPSTPADQEPRFMRMTYESGMVPTGEANVQFNFRFYLFALLFVIFDVEVIFLLPWAARFLSLGWVAFIGMAIFLILVLVGFLYEWKKEALEWQK